MAAKLDSKRPSQELGSSKTAKPNFGPVASLGLWLFLFALIFVVFLPCLRNDFIYLDDGPYVTENPEVQHGLSWSGLVWAFRTFAECNWHPLTWLSHMLDYQLFGLQPGGHHFISVLLHSLSAALLFLVFKSMTGAPWRSFFVAALFGLHPLRVESVAWVAERKDVLSTLFFMLTVWAYVGYVRAKDRSPKSEVRNPKSEIPEGARAGVRQATVAKARPRSGPLSRGEGEASAARPAIGHHPTFLYALALLFFVLGLLSKPMLVTLPFILLLLDYWPLGRFKAQSPKLKVRGWRLLLEKLPFFLLAAASSVVTLVAQRQAMTSLGKLAVSARVENALVSYSRYLGKLLWPLHLALEYPLPPRWPWPNVFAAGLLLVAISVVVIKFHRRFPWLFMGWFWLVGTLVPVIGLVQVGLQSMADRYSYIPSIGLLVMVVWGAYSMALQLRLKPAVLTAAAVVAVVCCTALTRRQIGYWKDNSSIFAHDLEVNGDNYLAYRHLAEHAFLKEHNPDKAIRCYQSALSLWPFWPEAHNNLAFILEKVGRLEEAIAESKKTVLINPKSVEARSNLGRELCLSGRLAEGIKQYEQAIALKADIPELHEGLGDALYKEGRSEEALGEYQTAARLKPAWVEPHIQLAALWCAQGRFTNAAAQCQEALRLRPGDPQAQTLLGAALLETGHADEAIPLLQEVVKKNPGYGDAHRRLGSAFYRQGSLNEAILEYQKALTLGVVDVDVQGNLGTALLNSRKFDEAIEHLQAAIRLKPDSFESHHNLGAALWSKGRFDEALREFEEAVKFAPTSPEAHRDFAFALASQGRKEEAIEQLNQALKLRPSYPEAEQQLRALTGQ